MEAKMGASLITHRLLGKGRQLYRLPSLLCHRDMRFSQVEGSLGCRLWKAILGIRHLTMEPERLVLRPPRGLQQDMQQLLLEEEATITLRLMGLTRVPNQTEALPECSDHPRPPFGGTGRFPAVQPWAEKMLILLPVPGVCRRHRGWRASNQSSYHSSKITTPRTIFTLATAWLSSGHTNPALQTSLRSIVATCSRWWVSGTMVGQPVFW